MGKWHFRGKRIISALIEQLVADHGIADASDLLIAGDSAGGVAAFNNAAFIAELLKCA